MVLPHDKDEASAQYAAISKTNEILSTMLSCQKRILKFPDLNRGNWIPIENEGRFT